jgi:5-formyltetrahydrofolate cyclo-ligase
MLSRDALTEGSRQVQAHAAELPEFGAARVVCSYIALEWEPGTAWLIDRARRDGKKICVPALQAGRDGYGLSAMTEGDRLVAGPHGVPQPETIEWVHLEDVDLMVVPGVAFDEQCRRLGRGGGHYDRLAGAPGGEKVFKVGLAFDWQIVERVPVGERDVRMDAVVTETKTTRRET